MLTLIISFLIASVVAFVLHGSTRRFVRTRLRYVDAIQKTFAPWAAGAVAFGVGIIAVSLLPIVGLGTAITAGLAVGSGVATGAKDIRQGTTPVVYGR